VAATKLRLRKKIFNIMNCVSHTIAAITITITIFRASAVCLSRISLIAIIITKSVAVLLSAMAATIIIDNFLVCFRLLPIVAETSVDSVDYSRV